MQGDSFTILCSPSKIGFWGFFNWDGGIKAACSPALCLEVLSVLILIEMFLTRVEPGVCTLPSPLKVKHGSAWPLCPRGLETSWTEFLSLARSSLVFASEKKQL